MTEPVTDQELLREFARERSERAFAALVERHLNLVYGVALRALGDAPAAQDVTQEVFVTLARKAVWLGSEVSLAGWLHRTARFKARHWWRTEARRRQREETATETSLAMKDDDSLLQSLAGVLDEGLLTLPERERQAVIMRFMEERSHREVGARLGIGEDAARKRSEKGLDQLTSFFRRRGYTVAGTATTATALRASVQAAPAGMGVAAVQAALMAGSSVPLTGLGLLLLKFMGLTKVQTAVVCLALAAGPLAWQANHIVVAQRERDGLAARRQTIVAQMTARQAEQAELEQKLKSIGQSLEDVRALVNRRQTLVKSFPKGQDPLLYRWFEDSPYVRLPKSMLPRIRPYDEAMDHWAKVQSLPVKSSPTFTRRGELSAVALEAIGLKPGQIGAARVAYARFVQEFEKVEQAHSRLADEMPDGKSSGKYPVMITEPFADQGEPLKKELFATFAGIMGPERAELLRDAWGNYGGFGNAFGTGGRHQRLDSIPNGSYAMVGDSEMGTTGGVLIEDLPEPLRAYTRAQIAAQSLPPKENQ